MPYLITHTLQGSNSSTDRRRKKPTTVAGPYIVYMLQEQDIVDDWTTIKKALTASKRKNKCKFSHHPISQQTEPITHLNFKTCVFLSTLQTVSIEYKHK